MAKKLYSSHYMENTTELRQLFGLTYRSYKRLLEISVVLAALVLIVALSVEVILGNKPHFARWFLNLQLVICLLFLASFFVGLAEAKSRKRYFFRNIAFLLLSIPYLNILMLTHFGDNRFTVLVGGLIPIFRSLLALFIIVRWAVRGSSAKSLFFAYILAVSLFTYVSALIFYDCEIGINESLRNFGDALWWAWMGLSTAGAQIVPATAIGKILGVVLPLMGMMILPIFTSYVLSINRQK